MVCLLHLTRSCQQRGLHDSSGWHCSGTSPSKDAGHTVDETLLIRHKDRQHVLLLARSQRLRVVHVHVVRLLPVISLLLHYLARHSLHIWLWRSLRKPAKGARSGHLCMLPAYAMQQTHAFNYRIRSAYLQWLQPHVLLRRM
jgi:hypothetical protein